MNTGRRLLNSGSQIQSDYRAERAARSTWPGVVNVAGNRFYEAEIVPQSQQIGTAITDNSDGEKLWLMLACSGNSTTDVASWSCSYEVSPDPIPSVWPSNQWWYYLPHHTDAIVLMDVFGAQEQHYVYQRLKDEGETPVYGFGKVNPGIVDSGQKEAKTPLVADGAGGGTFGTVGAQFIYVPSAMGGEGQIPYVGANNELVFNDPPEESEPVSGMPEGSEGAIAIFAGGEWLTLAAPAIPSMLVFDTDITRPKWLAMANNYQVPYRYNGGQIIVDNLRTTA